ncbi:hypothetical protein Terro_1853 [Terriglobus roseus DSM 18391]|uniref:Uncharacterized protein n=1 Tax=Terriglobus roseus (strain DSM 18391 / NRRL B-41598 / KBS 63) TaxID=926566 RepID=I3ZFX7_TERRK|nr:hypothetical protein [Terriglobus roseus]AFL88145.1 hypothetical protein Terro_1853 [Terriglobus roseus DSM 18391]
MLDLVKAVSVALSRNDAETLEQLALEACEGRYCMTALHRDELARATHVLTAQMNAASWHLELRSRMLGQGGTSRKAIAWDL